MFFRGSGKRSAFLGPDLVNYLIFQGELDKLLQDLTPLNIFNKDIVQYTKERSLEHLGLLHFHKRYIGAYLKVLRLMYISHLGP